MIDFNALLSGNTSTENRVTISLPLKQNGMSGQGGASLEVQPYSGWTDEQKKSLSDSPRLFQEWFAQKIKDRGEKSFLLWFKYPVHGIHKIFNATVTFSQTVRKGTSTLTYKIDSIEGGDGFVKVDVVEALTETKVIADGLAAITGNPVGNGEALEILMSVRQRNSERRVAARRGAAKRGFTKNTHVHKSFDDITKDDAGKIPAGFWSVNSSLT